MGHEVRASTDPGRYLCNYIFFKSLMAGAAATAAGACCYSLFVHVPPFTETSEAEQRLFIDDLLCVLARHVRRVAAQPDEELYG